MKFKTLIIISIILSLKTINLMASESMNDQRRLIAQLIGQLVTNSNLTAKQDFKFFFDNWKRSDTSGKLAALNALIMYQQDIDETIINMIFSDNDNNLHYWNEVYNLIQNKKQLILRDPSKFTQPTQATLDVFENLVIKKLQKLFPDFKNVSIETIKNTLKQKEFIQITTKTSKLARLIYPTPIFILVDKNTYFIDLKQIQEMESKRTEPAKPQQNFEPQVREPVEIQQNLDFDKPAAIASEGCIIS